MREDSGCVLLAKSKLTALQTDSKEAGAQKIKASVESQLNDTIQAASLKRRTGVRAESCITVQSLVHRLQTAAF